MSGQSSCQDPAGPGTAPHAAGRPASRKRGAGGPCGPQGPGQSRGDAGRSARRGANPDRCSGSGPRGHAPSWAWTREWEGGTRRGAGRPPTGRVPKASASRGALAGAARGLVGACHTCRRRVRLLVCLRLSRCSCWGRGYRVHRAASHVSTRHVTSSAPARALRGLAPPTPGPTTPTPSLSPPSRACHAHARPRLAPPRPAPSRPGHAAPGRAGGAVRARAQPSRVRRSSPPVRRRHPRPLVQSPPALTQATHSVIHSFIHTRTLSSAHSFTRSFIHPLAHSLIYPPRHSVVRSLTTLLLTHWLTRSGLQTVAWRPGGPCAGC